MFKGDTQPLSYAEGKYNLYPCFIEKMSSKKGRCSKLDSWAGSETWPITYEEEGSFSEYGWSEAS